MTLPTSARRAARLAALVPAASLSALAACARATATAGDALPPAGAVAVRPARERHGATRNGNVFGNRLREGRLDVKYRYNREREYGAQHLRTQGN